MQKIPIKTQIQITVALLGSSIRDGYGNGNITHNQRDFITLTAREILEDILMNIEESDVLIIPKNCQPDNPPDES
jgi:hypothetical protein